MEVNGQVHAAIRLPPSKVSRGAPLTGRWAFPRPGLGVVEKTKTVVPAGIEPRPTAS
jgi:hypothetical protein